MVASGRHRTSHPSVFQTRERDDFYSIGTSVCHVSTCQDKKKVWFAEWSLVFCLVGKYSVNRALLISLKPVTFAASKNWFKFSDNVQEENVLQSHVCRGKGRRR